MTEVDTMKVEIESYKGIEFVRISSLPDDQKEMFWSSFNKQKIIKILREKELLNDCLQYEDYEKWYLQYYPTNAGNRRIHQETAKELKLAFE